MYQSGGDSGAESACAEDADWLRRLELGIGLLLPCNVVVYDNLTGTSTEEAMDPQAARGLVGDNPAVVEVPAGTNRS